VRQARSSGRFATHEARVVSASAYFFRPSRSWLWRITGFVDGETIWSTSGAIRSLDGCVGFLVQEQAVEIRKFELIER